MLWFYGMSTIVDYLKPNPVFTHTHTHTYIYIYIVTWYAPERGKVRFNSPYPSVFELTSPATDRWGSENTGQSYLHSVTPNWLDEEGNVGHWIAWPGEVEEEEGVKWLAEAFAPKIMPLRQRKFGRGFSVFRIAASVKRRADLLAKTPGK